MIKILLATWPPLAVWAIALAVGYIFAFQVWDRIKKKD